LVLGDTHYTTRPRCTRGLRPKREVLGG
jgi:hypothetical protein